MEQRIRTSLSEKIKENIFPYLNILKVKHMIVCFYQQN